MTRVLHAATNVGWVNTDLYTALQWRHNGRDGVSNRQPRDCLLNRLFRCRSKKTSKLRVPGLCAANYPHKWPVTRKMFPFDDVIVVYLFFSFRSSVPRKSTEREDLQWNSNRQVCISVLQIILANSVCVHFIDVILGAMASQITGVSIVCSNVCSVAEQRKHQNSALLAFVGESTGERWIPLTKGWQHGKCFHLMTSSCVRA